MTTVILVLHLMIAAALVAIVLVQRSEGGALGIGGGGGGFMTGRSAANLLTRITAALAAAFFGTSIILALLASHGSQPRSVLDGVKTEGSAPANTDQNAPTLPKLNTIVPPSAPAPSGPQVPQPK
jgi:preprotein translocase subunit SecG